MEEILIEDYNYPLPDERIAKYPLTERDQSKLLVYRDGQVGEDKFCRVGEYLPDGSLLIYNNTRVIQARLEFHKTTATQPYTTSTPPLHNTLGARIEIFCLEPLAPHDYQLSLGSTEGCTWKQAKVDRVYSSKSWRDHSSDIYKLKNQVKVKYCCKPRLVDAPVIDETAVLTELVVIAAVVGGSIDIAEEYCNAPVPLCGSGRHLLQQNATSVYVNIRFKHNFRL